MSSSEQTSGGSPAGPADPTPGAVATENTAADAPVVEKDPSLVEAGELKHDGRLPNPEERLDALGIPHWRELEKKLVRRLDMTLMPCLWVLYFFNYMDRASIGHARLSTLDKDLGLVGSNFSTAVSILSAGYVLGQIPSNMIIGKVRPSIYLCSMAIVWSAVSAATCGVTNFQGLVIVRFFLGLVEAPLLPGAVYLLSCWYTRKEIAFRVAILYSAQTLAFCVAGLIAAAVYGTLEQRYGLAGWQWLFIVLAVTGSGLAIVALFLLPDYPDSKTGSASWTMTADMRKVAAMRILVDRPSTAEAKPGVWHGLKLSVKDPKLWILTMMNISISAAYGFSNFFPSIVRGFGYSTTITLVLTAPPYIFAAMGSYANAWHSDRTKERGWHYAVPVVVASCGFVICLATSNASARYGASFIYVGGMYVANPMIMGMVSGAMGRSPEKRAISIAICNVLSQIGNFVAPYFFLAAEEPQYRTAFACMMALGFLSGSCALLLKWKLTRSNKRLLREANQNGTSYQPYVT